MVRKCRPSRSSEGLTLSEWAALGTPLTDGLMVAALKECPDIDAIGKTRAELWELIYDEAVARGY